MSGFVFVEFVIKHLPALIIALPLFTAFIVPILSKINRHMRNALLLVAAALNAVMCFMLGGVIAKHSDGILTYVMGGLNTAITMPSGKVLPFRIILSIDGFSVLMAISASIIAISMIIYSMYFMKKAEQATKYYALAMLILAALNGIFLTGDLFNLFVFVEILSIASAGIICVFRNDDEAHEAAFKYLIISSLSALLVLFGIIMLYNQYGALNMAALSTLIQYSLADKIALTLMIVGFAMKCGAIPMHMWIPDAYSKAPAPMTPMFIVISQASLYALTRVAFSLFGINMDHALVGWIVIILGLLSMFVGVLMALPQKNIKRLIAYHAISQTGYMLLGIGVGIAVLGNSSAMSSYGTNALTGGLFHIINHALYKGLLFLAACALIYRLGTADLNEMGGMAKKMPVTAILFIIGALAITGIPPFNGFASKFIIYESVFMFSPILAIIAMVVSILTLASFMKVFYSAFLGNAKPEHENITEVPTSMLFAMLILGVLVVVIGLFPGIVVERFIEPASNALINHASFIGAVIP
jgi:multicomponent Na+:H+ antiporter subunit D